MARSFTSNLKGALTHADKAFAGNLVGGCELGCSGCLIAFVAMLLLAFVIEFWPVLLAILALVLLVWGLTKVSRTCSSRLDKMSETSRGIQSPAGWYADPLGAHQYRFWNGFQWTDYVAQDGVVSRVPL